MFRIDANNVRDAFSLSRAEYDSFRDMVVGRVAARFVRDVSTLASSELNSTRSEYLRAISLLKPETGVAVVELNGKLANMIEKGASPFDQKEGFARSGKKKQKLDGGWYMTIPFSHSSPDSTGDFATLGEAMPASVYDQAVTLQENESLSDDGSLPRLSARQRLVSEGREFNEYIRRHSPYEGMQRNTRSGHSGYVTFRRVSDKSDANSWIHKGFVARNFFERAYDETRLLHEVDVARDQLLSAL